MVPFTEMVTKMKEIGLVLNPKLMRLSDLYFQGMSMKYLGGDAEY